MISEEEKDAIKELKRFTSSHTDMKAISMAELKIIYNLIEKQNKMIKLMAEQFEIMKDGQEEIDCFIPREYSDIDDCVKKDSCQECIIEYFRNKAKESE